MRKSDLLFFLTGAAALVYETVWIRLLARLLGSDAGALAVVLAIFMGGLGLGAWAFGGVARRSARPALLFAALEIGLGLWAALSPSLLALAGPLENPVARFSLVAALLLPPTLAMGATFPLMGRLVIRDDSSADREVCAFYGANTLGAACGALLGPLVLMPALGLSGALYAAAGLDALAAAGVICWLSANAPQVARHRPAPWLSAPLAATFLLGFCGLGLEVILARLLISVTGASVYAYSIVLFVFLAGIGLGSRKLASLPDTSPWQAGRKTLRLTALALPAATLLGLLALRWQLGEASLFGALSNRAPGGVGLVRLWSMHALFAILALLGPALCLGAALPSAVAACAADSPSAARESLLGRVFACNTAGGLCGSVVAAFLLLGSLGPGGALAVLLGCAWLAGLVLKPRQLGAPLGALALALIPAGILSAGGTASPDVEVLYLEHDSLATISVEARDDGPTRLRSLRVNGKIVATTAAVDLRLQRLLGYLPGFYHPRVERALVIGLGTGMTASALLDLQSLEHLDIFEISSAMPGAARHFSAENGSVLDDPRLQLATCDGRHALATSSERWDLITSDPIHPWTRGSSDLYALEHFESMAAHLAPGGVASQWLPLYQLSLKDVKTVLATWTAAFEHTAAWLTAYDLALIGSGEALQLDRAMGLKMGHEKTPWQGDMALHLAQAGVGSWNELAALEVARDGDLRAYCAGVEPMRDNRPVLEFRAPLSFLAGYSREVLAWAGRGEFVANLPAACRPRAREVRALLDEFLAAPPGSLGTAAREYGNRLLALPPL